MKNDFKEGLVCVMKKMKKIWMLVILSMILSMSFTATVMAYGEDEYSESDDVEEPLTFKCDYYKKEATLVDVDSSVNNLVIPEFYDGCVVTEIRLAWAYWDHLRAESVYIPRTVEAISERSFENAALKKVVFEDGSKLKKLDYRVFHNCENLESVVLAQGIEEIDEGAFYECHALQSIDLPKSLRVIGDSAFDDCWSLKSISMSENVEKIGNYAFGNCALETINIPTGLKDIGEGAFYACDKLQSVVGKVPKFPKNVFYGCSSLSEINIKGNVTQIGEQALGKTGLRSIVIPTNVQSIKWGALSECEQLKKIIFQSDPNGLVNGGISANSKAVLYGCYGGNVENYARDNGLNFVGYGKVENVSVKYKNGVSRISWDAIESISQYKVYRRTDKSGGYELIGTTDETNWTDRDVEREKTYYYVIAVDHLVEEVEIKDVRSKTATLKMPEVTVKPTVKLSTDNKSVAMTWKKDAEAKSYIIYRSESVDGTYK